MPGELRRHLGIALLMFLPLLVLQVLSPAVLRAQPGVERKGDTSAPSSAGISEETPADSSLRYFLSFPLAGAPSPASPLDLFLPDQIRAGYLTRAWVRDSLPPASALPDDLLRMDMIYLRAFGEAGGDIETALMAALIASFEHRTIPFTFGMELPLTLEPREKFEQRVALLPRRLFLDRPGGDDSDKLQHFFASAWLAMALDNGSAADLVGLGVELGEALFIRGGANDPRDVRANRLGHLYAELLRKHPQALPSTMFRAWNREFQRRVDAARN